MPLMPLAPAGLAAPATATPRDAPATDDMAALRRTARDFETAFLAETLKHMGLDRTQGVAGAAPFSSFVNRAYAEGIVERGGLGLAENIVRSLATRTDTP